RRLQLREHRLEVVGRVLGIEQDPVETCPSDHLHRVVRRDAGPQADLRPAGGDRVLEGVHGQFQSGLLSFWFWLRFGRGSAPGRSGIALDCTEPPSGPGRRAVNCRPVGHGGRKETTGMAEYITIESQALTRAIAAIVSAGGSSAEEAQQVAESL